MAVDSEDPEPISPVADRSSGSFCDFTFTKRPVLKKRNEGAGDASNIVYGPVPEIFTRAIVEHAVD